VKRTLVVFLAVLGFALAHTALAMAYWDYQGYLPSGGGPRSFYMHEYLGNNDYPVEVRMSWSSSPSHYMNFIYLHTDGSWEISQITPGTPGRCNPSADHDCYYFHGYGHPHDAYGYSTEQFGCQNPSGQSQAYVNCKVSLFPIPWW
jgi:hypothetical protein